MQLVWTALRAGLLPIRLRDLEGCLDAFVETIARSNGRRPGVRQREAAALGAAAIDEDADALAVVDPGRRQGGGREEGREGPRLRWGGARAAHRSTTSAQAAG